jgi:exopolysaccharide biosynthesis protein
MLALAGVAAAGQVREPLPASTLAVMVDGHEVTWWRSDRAPSAWRSANDDIVRAVRWHDTTDAVAWGELSLRGSGEAFRTDVVLVRIDPRRATLRLDLPPADASPAGWLSAADWSIALAPANARVAMNAGQFTAGGAWGWLMRDGREVQPPRFAPLAPAIVVESTGAVRIVAARDIDSVRTNGSIAQAFQSYPTLLEAGRVPRALQYAGLGIDVAHRDARLALGILPDGRMLIALTRFAGLGGVLDRLPFGLTTPEMAALMGALGCADAMLLDGGVSGQLLVRDAAGEAHEWPGMRRVPVGLVVTSPRG